MSSQQQETEDCAVCHRPRKDHSRFRHDFRAFGESPTLSESAPRRESPDQVDPASQGRIRIATGGDPVLRMTLIRAGVISVGDLDKVEAELRATGVAGYEPDQTLG